MQGPQQVVVALARGHDAEIRLEPAVGPPVEPEFPGDGLHHGQLGVKQRFLVFQDLGFEQHGAEVTAEIPMRLHELAELLRQLEVLFRIQGELLRPVADEGFQLQVDRQPGDHRGQGDALARFQDLADVARVGGGHVIGVVHEIGLMRGGAAFAGVIVTAHEIGGAELVQPRHLQVVFDVGDAADARAFAVPGADDAVHLGGPVEAVQHAAPHHVGGGLLVAPGHVKDVPVAQEGVDPAQVDVQPAQRAALVTGNEVSKPFIRENPLQQPQVVEWQPHQRLDPGQVDVPFGAQVAFFLQGNGFFQHNRASFSRLPPPR